MRRPPIGGGRGSGAGSGEIDREALPAAQWEGLKVPVRRAGAPSSGLRGFCAILLHAALRRRGPLVRGKLADTKPVVCTSVEGDGELIFLFLMSERALRVIVDRQTKAANSSEQQFA